MNAKEAKDSAERYSTVGIRAAILGEIANAAATGKYAISKVVASSSKTYLETELNALGYKVSFNPDEYHPGWRFMYVSWE